MMIKVNEAAAALLIRHNLFQTHHEAERPGALGSWRAPGILRNVA